MSGTGFTAGAVPVFNQKGQVSMQKVKVQRYVSGRRPDYAEGPSDEESDSGDELSHRLIKREDVTAGSSSGGHAVPSDMLPAVIGRDRTAGHDNEDDDGSAAGDKDGKGSVADEEEDIPIPEEAIKSDRRLQRLMNRTRISGTGDGRAIADPQILTLGTTDSKTPVTANERRHRSTRHCDSDSDDDDDDDNEIKGKDNEHDDEEKNEKNSLSRRHELARRLKREDEEEELMDRLEGKDDGDGDDEDGDGDSDSEYSDYSDSGDEMSAVPRLKPVFVRKEERVTVKERQLEEEKEREREEQCLKEAEDRRTESLRIIEEEVRREAREAAERAEDEAMSAAIDAVVTDDESEDHQEASYESWKLRELKRIKREVDERTAAAKESEEKERLRNMTEEERKAELERNPKVITNAAEKGKYRFMQKYYHRGAFYLDEEAEVLKRNVAEPTLEDHFDKSVLPAVMQVKDFGRAGRTKYTHLVDQDTTVHDGPWAASTLQSQKFVTSIGGGFKPVFERPSKRRKT